MLWPNASQDTIIAAFPGRTWKAIAHQAYNQGWRRTPNLCNQTPRRRWEPDEEHTKLSNSMRLEHLHLTSPPNWGGVAVQFYSELGRSVGQDLMQIRTSQSLTEFLLDSFSGGRSRTKTNQPFRPPIKTLDKRIHHFPPNVNKTKELWT